MTPQEKAALIRHGLGGQHLVDWLPGRDNKGARAAIVRSCTGGSWGTTDRQGVHGAAGSVTWTKVLAIIDRGCRVPGLRTAYEHAYLSIGAPGPTPAATHPTLVTGPKSSGTRTSPGSAAPRTRSARPPPRSSRPGAPARTSKTPSSEKTGPGPLPRWGGGVPVPMAERFIELAFDSPVSCRDGRGTERQRHRLGLRRSERHLSW